MKMFTMGIKVPWLRLIPSIEKGPPVVANVAMDIKLSKAYILLRIHVRLYKNAFLKDQDHEPY